MPPDQNNQYIGPQQYLEQKKSPKKWLIGGILTILILVGIFVTTNLASTQKIFKGRASELDEIQAELKTLTSVDETANENHPELFYVDLEYDPSTGLMTQTSSGITRGDHTGLYKDISQGFPGYFVFKVVVVKDDQVTDSGWLVTSAELARTPQGTFEFHVTTPFITDSIIYIYLEDSPGSWNQLVWSGLIQ